MTFLWHLRNALLGLLGLCQALWPLVTQAAIPNPLKYEWKIGSTKLRNNWDWYLVDRLTGSYVSVFPVGRQWWGFSTEWPRNPAVPGVCPGAKCPGLIRFVGASPNDLSQKVHVVLPNEAIDDVMEQGTAGPTLATKRMFTRPTVVKVSKPGGGFEFWGFVYVANSYPPVGGRVFPATIYSPDGVNWTYLGKVKGDLATLFPDGTPYWGSGHALEVRAGTVPLNMKVPAANKFFALIDGTRIGVQLAALFSADGRTWYLGKNPNGTVKELLPADLKPRMIGPVFPSVRKVGTAGYIAAVPDGWYSEGASIRDVKLIHSCNGGEWQAFGNTARQDPSFIGQKTSSLAFFDPETRILYLYASWGNGVGTSNFQQILNKIIVPKTIPCPVGTVVIP